MATTKLNYVINTARRVLKDAQSLSTDDGRRYTSAVMAVYANRAQRDLISDLFDKYKYAVGNAVPELIKTSSALTLSSGVVAVPSDCFLVMEVSKSDYSLQFERVPAEWVESVRAGKDGVISPSTTKPVFWQEGTNVYTKGVTTGDVILRYIVMPADISPVNGTSGAGKINSGTGSFAIATKRITITMAEAMDANDINRLIVFRSTSTSTVYVGRIVDVPVVGPSSAQITVDGEGIPSANVSNITVLMVSAVTDVSSDLVFGWKWLSALVDRVVELAKKDAQ